MKGKRDRERGGGKRKCDNYESYLSQVSNDNTYAQLCPKCIIFIAQFTSSKLVRVESEKVLTASSLFCCPFGLFHMLLPVMLAFINKRMLIATETKR